MTEYIVLEGGGVDYEPKLHGVFNNLGLAKECIKSAMLEFLKSFDDLDEGSVVIDKRIVDNYTYFYIYQDKQEMSYGAYMNVFVLTEIK